MGKICIRIGTQIELLINLDKERKKRNEVAKQNLYFLTICKNIISFVMLVTVLRYIIYHQLENISWFLSTYVLNLPGMNHLWSAMLTAGQSLMAYQLIQRTAYHQLLIIHTVDDVITAFENSIGLASYVSALVSAIIYVMLVVMCNQSRLVLHVLSDDK